MWASVSYESLRALAFCPLCLVGLSICFELRDTDFEIYVLSVLDGGATIQLNIGDSCRAGCSRSRFGYEFISPGLGFPAGFFIDEEKDGEKIQR
jgi:hypothetical protein